jgi:hypothetical protein
VPVAVKDGVARYPSQVTSRQPTGVLRSAKPQMQIIPHPLAIADVRLKKERRASLIGSRALTRGQPGRPIRPIPPWGNRSNVRTDLCTSMRAAINR